MSLGRIVKLPSLLAKPLHRAYSAVGIPELTQVIKNLL